MNLIINNDNNSTISLLTDSDSITVDNYSFLPQDYDELEKHNWKIHPYL